MLGLSTEKGSPITAHQAARVAGRRYALLALVFSFMLLASCKASPVVETFAAGLNQPRGLAFDAEGNLYVAEAGMIDADADTRSAPIISHSSRVLRFSPDGQRATVVDGLPFTNYAAAGDVGATDVLVLDGTLYVLTGEGYDDQLSRAVLSATRDGLPEPVANLFHFVEQTTTLDSSMGISTLASNPYAMIAAPDGHTVYVSDGASGRVFQVSLDGTIRVFVEVPNKPPLTGLTFGPDSQIYFAVFSALPLAPGNGAIWTADGSGKAAVVVPQLAMPIDVAFDNTGTMYVLEFTSRLNPDELYASDSGRLLRIAQDGTQTVVLDRLNYPTAMTFAPTGDLYISVSGAFGAPRQGAVLKVPCRELGAGESACPR